MIAIDPPVRILIFPLASEGPSTHAPRRVKWADFRQCTAAARYPRRGLTVTLHECSMALIRAVFPLRASIRLVGVTLSNFQAVEADPQNQLPLGACAARSDAALQLRPGGDWTNWA
jgi:hypothetical protein